MRSKRPKPLHRICGRPMVSYVIDALASQVEATIVVVGHGATWVEKELRDRHGDELYFVEQVDQLGTGHAVVTALPAVADVIGAADADVLVLPGDAPLLRAGTLDELIRAHQDSAAAITVLSAVLEDPTGYGRVLRSPDGSLERIVEEREASASQRQVREVNTAVMVVRAELLGPGLRRVGRQNVQHEYYLSDLPGVLRGAGHVAAALTVQNPLEVTGVNDRAQLASVETEMRRRINERWLQRGVSMWDPAHSYVDADVVLSPDVSLLPGTVLRGACVIGAAAVIGPHAYLQDTQVGEGAQVATTTLIGARIGARAIVAPYVVLGPGAVVEDGASRARVEAQPD